MRKINWKWAVVFSAFLAHPAQAFFVDGEGHYSLLGKTETSPGASNDRGMYQAVSQNFRLLGEVRLNEKASVFMQFNVFSNPRAAYLGDKGRPDECGKGTKRVITGYDGNGNPKYSYQNDEDCSNRHQSSYEPRYEPYTPRITQLYARYAFDYCLLDAGRRARDWGMGIYMNSGRGIFDEDATVFDGITCNVNLQKSQALGFSVGYDKLSETGSYIDSPYATWYTTSREAESNKSSFDNYDRRASRFGPTNRSDDLDQYFLSIEWDDRKTNAGAPFTKDIGFYFANVIGDKIPNTSFETDIKFLDLYTGFFLTDLAFQNEILFRLGKSVDPNWTFMGGHMQALEDESGSTKVDSIALAGHVDFTVARSGSYLGPMEYNKGDATRHAMTFDYAYAPGDADGYREDTNCPNPHDASNCPAPNRGNRVRTVAFHRNYKPALILFNGHSELDDMRVDGVYDPGRVMNTLLYAIGYKYESVQNGNIEVKLITAKLLEGMPQDVQDYESKVAVADGDQRWIGNRQVGYAGTSLGYELDLKYSRMVSKEVEFGGAGAALLPGKALMIEPDASTTNDFLLQAFVAFKF